MGVPTILLARTDAEAADLVTSDVDENDKPFLTGERTAGGLLPHAQGLRPGALARPRLRRVRRPRLVRDRHARPRVRAPLRRGHSQEVSRTRCSPTTARRRSTGRSNLDDATIAKFQRELGAMGYKFQFITLAGFHSLNYGMFELAHGYARNDMTAFVELQQKEFAAAEQRLHRGQAPARGRHRLLRRRDPGDPGGQVVDDGAARVDRGRAVLRGGDADPASGRGKLSGGRR